MPEQEYKIEENPITGEVKLIPVEKTGGGCLGASLLLGLFAVVLIPLVAPILFSIVGLFFNGKTRKVFGWITIASAIYFFTDLSNRWLSALWFFGWRSNDGKFNEPWFGDEYLTLFVLANIVGVIIGILLVALTKSDKKVNTRIKKQKKERINNQYVSKQIKYTIKDIENAGELLEIGAISQSEYELLKTQILKDMN